MLYKRIIVKFGTNLLTGGTDKLDQDIMANLVRQIANLHDSGHEIIVVTSGAVTAGRQKLRVSGKRKDIPFKQVLASIGQNQLMHVYERLFNEHAITVAQALLTKQDIIDRSGYLNARNTLLALIDLKVVCIVNENDVVAIDELGEDKFGDNDNLSAMVANLVDADLLVLLTDIEGLFTDDPRKNKEAKLISRVDVINDEIERLASGSISQRGVGGMTTKIEAARLATSSGVTMAIANGRIPGVLLKITGGTSIGTLFTPRATKLESKKRWMLSGLCCKGGLIVDDGATTALKTQNKSLLPAGVSGVEGYFERGDVVDIYDMNKNHIGYGIPNYSSDDISTIKGSHSRSISKVLGYEYGAEVVHRNNMVII